MSNITKKAIRKGMKIHSLIAVHHGENKWMVESGENFYNLEVFFQGYDSRYEHGLKLKAYCNCHAAKFGNNCCHADKVLLQYELNFSLLFGLFGMEVPEPLRFDELNQKIIQTERRLRENIHPERDRAA